MTDNAPTAPSGDSNPAAVLDTEEVGLAATFDGLSGRAKFLIFLLVVLVLAIIFAVWHDFYFHWFEVHTGTDNESGPYYGFWSGFGSDLGEATIVVGVVAAWRHHNCHVKGCARLGRAVDGTPYLACPKHHPAHQGQKRGISLEELHRAHAHARHERLRRGSSDSGF